MTCYIGLGSNLRDRRKNISLAHDKIKSLPGVELLKTSSLYENPAMTPPNSSEAWNKPFLNAAIEIECELNPIQLLKELKFIEEDLGRQAAQRWAPRLIDLDILLFANESIDEPDLHIPQKDIDKRAFALAPLSEIAPDLVFPDGISLRRKKQCLPNGLCQFMHILNFTPNSFSDGGQNTDSKIWMTRLNDLVQQGISIIDIGGESTAPFAPLINANDEWQRVQPCFDFFKDYNSEDPFRAKLSIDTWKASVAAKALENGASIVNDVSGLADPEMLHLLKGQSCDYVLMHSLGVPADPNRTLPLKIDAVDELKIWLSEKLELLEKHGIDRSRVIFDPGLGFGKTKNQSLEILQRVDELLNLPVRLLIGASRKSFMNLFTDASFANRDPESIAITIQMAQKGVDILRVHESDQHKRAYLSWLHLQNNVVSPL
ncbi:MAG: 2-amino-4-hydroxy-6-hydroxymethyldihydropteridine diphosphokinase/dihydropteroate synthase [Candidatus Azotimanducaceae bacterium]|jgi:2-amino-4-hydroxy-6-hydroxymethyldihydropteridine diphosphokinase/dihydropteroate synthase